MIICPCSLLIRLLGVADARGDRIEYLERELAVQRKEIFKISLAVRNLRQNVEAFSDWNRYFASEALVRPATDAEALDHYIQNGGAEGFASRVEVEKRRRGFLAIA